MRHHALMIAAVAALVAGCASSPTPRFYTLSVEAETNAVRTPAINKPAIEIAVVTIPDAVDRPQLVVRRDDNEVMIVEMQRWAGPLNRELPRVIAENLVRLLDNPHIAARHLSAGRKADYRLFIDFQRFDAYLGREAVIEAAWNMRSADGLRQESGRLVVRERANDSSHEALVAAFSRSLARLSAGLAQQISN
jgi:uncharacterized lipoprotein YmbA